MHVEIVFEYFLPVKLTFDAQRDWLSKEMALDLGDGPSPGSERNDAERTHRARSLSFDRLRRLGSFERRRRQATPLADLSQLSREGVYFHSTAARVSR